MRGQDVHAKALRIRPFWSEIGRTPGCSACETPAPAKSHTRECKAFLDAWQECRTCGRRATAEEVKRRDEVDQDTRPLDPSSSSDSRSETIQTSIDVENLAGQMDEDTSLSPTKSRLEMKREITQMENLQLYSWISEEDVERK